MAVVLVLALVAGTTAAQASRTHTVVPSDPAARVTRFVEQELSWRVLLIEGAALTANAHVLAYCVAPGALAIQCADLRLVQQGESTQTVLDGLREQERTLTAMSYALWRLPLPPLDGRAAVHLACLLEDLTLFSDQYARLLDDAANAIPGTTNKGLTPQVSYGAREQSIGAVLDRAEAWLETLDHDTGAQVTLPGFARGGTLDAQLTMQ
jgi:hypothetical protein